MNKKEMTAELEAAKAATNRSAIVELGWGHRNQESVRYKTESGEQTVVFFKYPFNANKFYHWIDAYFAD